MLPSRSPRAPAEGHLDVPYVVVGAGFTGMAAARLRGAAIEHVGDGDAGQRPETVELGAQGVTKREELGCRIARREDREVRDAVAHDL